MQGRNREKDVEKKRMDTKGGKRRGVAMVGRGSGGMNWEIGIDLYTLMCIKLMTNKNLLYSTGNSSQYFVMTYVGK